MTNHKSDFSRNYIPKKVSKSPKVDKNSLQENIFLKWTTLKSDNKFKYNLFGHILIRNLQPF